MPVWIDECYNSACFFKNSIFNVNVDINILANDTRMNVVACK